MSRPVTWAKDSLWPNLRLLNFIISKDEPGFVSSEPEMVELSTRHMARRHTSPAWGLDVKCEKHTGFILWPLGWTDSGNSYIIFSIPSIMSPVVMESDQSVGELRRFESFEIQDDNFEQFNL